MRTGVQAVGFLILGAALGVTVGQNPTLAPTLYAVGLGLLALYALTWPPVVKRIPFIGPWWTRRQRRPIADLKRDCRTLSDDILRYLQDRRRAEPTLTFDRAHWQEGTDALIRYGTETATLFHERFGARVLAVVGELRERGLPVPSDPKPDFQVNMIGMGTLAQEIGAIGLRLPD